MSGTCVSFATERSSGVYSLADFESSPNGYAKDPKLLPGDQVVIPD